MTFNPMVDNASQPDNPADSDPGDDGYEWGLMHEAHADAGIVARPGSREAMESERCPACTLVRRRSFSDDWESAS